MIKYRVNGKKVDVPSNWNDPTFRQYFQILTVDKNKDYRAIIAILLNMTEQEVNDAELENVHQLLEHISFTNYPAVMDPQPKTILNFIIPKDITLESLGQFEDMRKVMIEHSPRESDDDLEKIARITEAYPKYAAIYCQKLRDGKYDYEEAMKLSQKMWEAPALEVLSAGNFFFARLSGLTSSTKKIYRPRQQAWKKIKQGFQRFRQTLASMLP